MRSTFCDILTIFTAINSIIYIFSLDEAREEHDEFQISSRELESELETQLEQAESKNRELVAVKSRLQKEGERIKGRGVVGGW